MSGGIVRISPENMISEMRNWQLEASSHYNDGYIKQHYQDHLDLVFKAVDDMRMSKEDKEIEVEKANWICEECGKSTFETDYDYLINPQLHLGCQLEKEGVSS